MGGKSQFYMGWLKTGHLSKILKKANELAASLDKEQGFPGGGSSVRVFGGTLMRACGYSRGYTGSGGGRVHVGSWALVRVWSPTLGEVRWEPSEGVGQRESSSKGLLCLGQRVGSEGRQDEQLWSGADGRCRGGGRGCWVAARSE